MPCHYRGQTGCSIHKRNLEHLGAIRRGDTSHGLASHFLSIHPGVAPEDRLVEARIKDNRALNMDRGVMEALRIKEIEDNLGILVANKKSKWGRLGLKRVTITDA